MSVYPATAKRDADHAATDDLKCSIYCREVDYDFGNLKNLSPSTKVSLMPREAWEILGHLGDGKALATFERRRL